MCIKSDFEEIILKLATYGQRGKEKRLSVVIKILSLRGCLPWGYIHVKHKNIYQDQVSGERLQDHWSSDTELLHIL